MASVENKIKASIWQLFIDAIVNLQKEEKTLSVNWWKVSEFGIFF